jgi:hypothetical protein
VARMAGLPVRQGPHSVDIHWLGQRVAHVPVHCSRLLQERQGPYPTLQDNTPVCLRACCRCCDAVLRNIQTL